MTGGNDPMEGMIRGALKRAAIRYVEGDRNDARLDFFLPDHGIYIEVKQFHSDRIGEQMSRAPNVIAVQGRQAVEWLVALIDAGAAFKAAHPSGESDPAVTLDCVAPAP